MKILLTGSSGFIGTHLQPALVAAGHEVTPLVRSQDQTGTIYWNPATREIDTEQLEGCDAVIHLAGESIASRWTPARQAEILHSRSAGTSLLCEALAALQARPQVLLSASAVGYYGDRADETLTEGSSPGHNFLAHVCQAWEAATLPAAEAGIRVVNTRFGMVLSPTGGALKVMLPAFRLGLGGRFGDGRQYISWIALDDLLAGLQHCLTTTSLAGPVNFVTPYPITNQEFTVTLGQVLRKPTILPVPAFAARLLLGEMADEMLLASTRAEPGQLQESGFAFRYPQLQGALQHLIAS